MKTISQPWFLLLRIWTHPLSHTLLSTHLFIHKGDPLISNTLNFPRLSSKNFLNLKATLSTHKTRTKSVITVFPIPWTSMQPVCSRRSLIENWMKFPTVPCILINNVVRGGKPKPPTTHPLAADWDRILLVIRRDGRWCNLTSGDFTRFNSWERASSYSST